MNRSAEQLDELIQELSTHHGDDSFAIVNDIVRANSSDSDETICNTVASVLGGSPYVRPVKVLRRPQEANSPPATSPNAIRVPPPSVSTAPPRPVVKPAKSVLPTEASANPFDALSTKPKTLGPKKPIQSLWKTVINEHRSDTYADVPVNPNADAQPRFEDVDFNALEDVDPVAFEMARNPEFFTAVPTSEEYQHMLIAQESTMPSAPAAFAGAGVRESQPRSAVPSLAAQTLILDSDDETDPSMQIPSYLRASSQPTDLPTSWITTSSSASFVARNHHIPSSPSPSAPSATITSSSDAAPHVAPMSVSSSQAGPSSTSLDFFLPPPPENEEEAKRIMELLASGNHSMRASSNWSASGEYAIAPSPSTLRQSLGVSNAGAQNPIAVVDLTHLPDEEQFVLDTEALDFLGQIFPDFEPSYLADCLRGANNDVERVSEFLMPIEMEEIAEDDVPFDESLYMHDPSSPLPQFEIPAHLMHAYDFTPLDAPYAEPEAIDLEEEETLPEEDATFNQNYHDLVEIYPHVDRDWVLDALINTDNDLSRAADLLMRGLTSDPNEVAQVNAAVNGAQNAKPVDGRRGRNRRAKKVAVKLPPPNAWVRRPAVTSDAPLSEYPILSTDVPEYYDGQKGPIRIRPVPTLPFARAADGSPQLPSVQNGGGSYRDIMNNAAVPVGMSRERAYGTLILKKMLEDEAALRAQYVSVEDRAHAQGNWALLMARANALFEETNGGRHAAVAAFARNRRVCAVSVISQLQATNESWMKLVEEAGEQFYTARIPTLDLHGLRLRPASKLVAAILQTHWTNGSEQRSLEIITGRGAHSIGGIARIKEDIRRQIRDYHHVWTNPGSVKVLLPKPAGN